jgi:hypothetical protein
MGQGCVPVEFLFFHYPVETPSLPKGGQHNKILERKAYATRGQKYTKQCLSTNLAESSIMAGQFTQTV